MTALVLAALLLLATACGAGDDAADVAGGASGTAPAAAGAPGAAADGVPQALAFTATTLSGETFDGGEYAGQDLMLWFWAPW